MTHYLTLDGTGHPYTSAEYGSAVRALQMVAYALRFSLRRTHGLDWAPGPPEGLWRLDAVAERSAQHDAAPCSSQWTLLMAVHELVDHDAVAAVTSAGNRRNEAVARVRLTTMSEGRCAQLLHVGPLSAMPMTIDRLHEFISDQDFVLAPQPHHELYLSDSSRVDADRWRTVIRQPVASSIS